MVSWNKNTKSSLKVKMFMLFYFSLIIVLLGSCSSTQPRNTRYIYSAPMFSPSYFQEKGDSKISLNVSSMNEKINGTTTSNEFGIDPQIAYAFSNHWMASVGIIYRDEFYTYNDNDVTGSKTDQSKIKYNRIGADFGIGYFTPLTEKIYFNLNSGIRLGKFNSKLTDK